MKRIKAPGPAPSTLQKTKKVLIVTHLVLSMKVFQQAALAHWSFSCLCLFREEPSKI